MIPISEIYGPVVQGEGDKVGTLCTFVRVAGCDMDCEWCDSKYARHGTKMSVDDILDGIRDCPLPHPEWVVLTGGNPCLYEECGELVNTLMDDHFVAVETQGSVIPGWISRPSWVTFSPKPPSSGEEQDLDQLEMAITLRPALCSELKVVAFDKRDLEYARDLHRIYPQLPFTLQIGTRMRDHPYEIGDRATEIIRHLKDYPELSDVRILPQVHICLWGHGRGV